MMLPKAKFPGLAQPYFRVLDTFHYRLPREVTLSYKPPQLCALYDLPTNVVGPTMKIAIISLGGGYKKDDVNFAFDSWNMPRPIITDISIQGATNQPGSDADIENALDIQISGASNTYSTNQSAHINFYSAPNTDQGFRLALRQAYLDDCANTSISWGAMERSWGLQACTDFDTEAANSVTAGTTVHAASGDNLSSDGGTGLNVDFPSSSPHVVGWGGTRKLKTVEDVWNENGGGTGGGYSEFFKSQSWQIGAPSMQGRMVPDCAADAAPSTGWIIRVNGQWMVVGGTSCAAPFGAGFFTTLAMAAGKKLGNVLPIMWKHPADWTDITVGNNGAQRASAGPDACTGLGVPIGSALMRTFAPPPPPPPPPATVTVPLVVGLSWSAAGQALTNAGLKISPSTTPDPTVKVASQSPMSGTTVNKGSTVVVILGNNPPPPPPPPSGGFDKTISVRVESSDPNTKVTVHN